MTVQITAAIIIERKNITPFEWGVEVGMYKTTACIDYVLVMY